MKTRVACADGVEMLMDYLEDTLPAAERARIEAHVSRCPRCIAFVESYRQTPRILRAATAAAFPDDLARSLRAFLASHR
jgi:anti-sigma factor RsiW